MCLLGTMVVSSNFVADSRSVSEVSCEVNYLLTWSSGLSIYLIIYF